MGAFGRNHARVYRDLTQIGEVEFVGIVDHDHARASAVAAEFGTRAFTSIDELLREAKPEAASVTVPTVEHLNVARELMEAGVDVLIEKPLAPSLAEADELIRLAENPHADVREFLAGALLADDAPEHRRYRIDPPQSGEGLAVLVQAADGRMLGAAAILGPDA